uniref:Uncharacterized protein n=1 Tax=Dugesia ryukyuensis TaxID=79738 RepID=A7M6D8_DUGRY|nr:hypothetical protein [Dugesia ryukyuensis]
MESNITPGKLIYSKTECILCHCKVQDLTRHLNIVHKLTKPEAFLMMYMYPPTGEDRSNLSFHEIKCLMTKSIHGMKALTLLNSEQQQLLAMEKVKKCFQNSRSLNNYLSENEMSVLINELTDCLPSTGKSKAYKQNTSIALKHLYNYAVSHNLNVKSVFDLFSKDSIEYLVSKPELKLKSKHNYLCGMSVLLDQMSSQIKESVEFDEIGKIINSYKLTVKRSLIKENKLKNVENSHFCDSTEQQNLSINTENVKRKHGDLDENVLFNSKRKK